MQTLVLNATSEVMKIVDWKRAVTWFFLNKIDIIEEYENNILTPSLKMKIPSVVKFKNLIKQRHRPVKFTKINIYIRDKYCCQYCAKKMAPKMATLDHLLPRSRGGKSSWLNCVACCKKCNTKKADQTPQEANMKLTKEPWLPSQREVLSMFIESNVVIIPNEWKNYYLSNSII